MKNVLYINCLIRENDSRTGQIAGAFLRSLDAERCHVTELRLMDLGLQPFSYEKLKQRDQLLAKGDLNNPFFDLARQFAQADAVVIAAPFWDLSFPSLLKVYIEHVSVEGITFGCGERGLYGLCKGQELIYLTTRGGCYQDSPLEQGSRYLEVMHQFFGFDQYHCIAAEGLDIDEHTAEVNLGQAVHQAEELARALVSA